MINLQELEKVAEFKNGELNWLEGRDINAVYVILVGDEYYIGSSHYTYLRIGQHLNELQKGTHHSDKFQKKFDEKKEFEVYCLERGIEISDLKKVEFDYIKKYRPHLNVMTLVKKGEIRHEPRDFKDRVKWMLKERGMTMAELASIIRTTQTSISRMLGENGNPTYDTLMKIADALGVEIQELFSENKTFSCPHCGKPIEVALLQEKEG